MQIIMNQDITMNSQNLLEIWLHPCVCTSVLEIGCGTGIDLRLFPDTFQIFGIDLNKNALNIAKEKLAIADFKKGGHNKITI